MSIKRKFLVCFLVMLVIPVVLILLLSICLLAVFTLLHPTVELSLTSGLEISNPIVTRFLIAWALMSVLIIIATGIAMTAYLSRSILQPIREMTRSLERLKNGDLTCEFTGAIDAELQALCSSLESLRLRLQKNVQETLYREQEHRMLLANFSHDIKTPITSIRGYVDGILEGVADTPEKMQRYLDTIRQKADAIESMADNLSLYSKLEMKKIPYHMEVRDIFSFLRETMREFELDLHDGGMALSCDIPNTPVSVCFDAEKLRRVCDNLISNAVKYKNGPTGSLSIVGQIISDGILISFSDTGIGIAPQDQKKVFEGFYRGDPSRNSGIKGNGLGLSICRQIIADHNGKIWIHSKETEGTCVFVFLPIIKDQSKELQP